MPDSAGDDTELLRLHITPLNPSLLSTYLSAQQQKLTSNVSFHSILTFPERAYGFVTLPKMEADKIKKKFHGSILKGNKIRVEEAKPEKRKADDEVIVEEQIGKKRKTKRSKREEGVFEGIELPDGRKVKRGWTDPEPYSTKKSKDKKDKKDKKAKSDRKPEKSKYTKEPELLFKTTVPPNLAADEDSKASKKKEKRKASKKDREVVVHEFENTKKQSSFLRSTRTGSKAKIAAEFVDGKGWVDEDGNLVEEVNTRITRQSKSAKDKAPEVEKKSKDKKRKKDKAVSISEEPEKTERKHKQKQKSTETPEDMPSPPETIEQTEKSPKEVSPSQVEGSEDIPKTPHPLETIYKRTQNRPTFIDTSFSFFDDGDDAGADGSLEVGQSVSGDEREKTPFSRNMRSGAPTPDTAAAFRRFSFSRGVVDQGEDAIDEDDEDEESDHLSQVSEGDEGDDKEAGQLYGEGEAADEDGKVKEESVFAKWFWENRGENNRTWKRMRKEAMKEKRKRENRRIGRKIV
jgi:hypothetical protein